MLSSYPTRGTSGRAISDPMVGISTSTAPRPTSWEVRDPACLRPARCRASAWRVVIDAPPRLVLLGHPVAHSLSPLFFKCRAARRRIPLTLRDARASIRYGAREAPWRCSPSNGSRAMSRSPTRSASAHCVHGSRHCGACRRGERFWHEDGQLIGDNNDVGGAEAMMRAPRRVPPFPTPRSRSSGRRQRGIGTPCGRTVRRSRGAAFNNRHMQRADRSLPADSQSIRTRQPPSLAHALVGAPLVVNASAVGLHGDALPVPIRELPTGCACVRPSP